MAFVVRWGRRRGGAGGEIREASERWRWCWSARTGAGWGERRRTSDPCVERGMDVQSGLNAFT